MRGGLISRWTRCEGERWHVRVGGPLDAPPVVMPHGLVISSRYLVPLARLLARDHRVLLPDLPGFGRSSKPREVWDVPRMARGLAAWMEAEGMPRAALVGNSMGCQMIVELAAQAPDRVERAVLIGPTMDPDAGAWGNAARLLLDIPREHPRLWLDQVIDAVRAGARRGLATYRHALAHPMLARAAQVRCPTLVVRGTRDPIAPAAWTRRVAEAVPDARVVEVEGPHVLNYTAAERLAPVVRAFLASPPEGPEGVRGRTAFARRRVWRAA